MSDPIQPGGLEEFYAIPSSRARKADPALIGPDLAQFSAIETGIRLDLANLDEELTRVRRRPTRMGQEALDRDAAARRLAARIDLLRRYGADLCLGRIVPAGEAPVYIGRIGMRGPDGNHLLLDWRAPAAEPFFAATLANPCGLTSRRRYRWYAGRVIDYWDEVFDLDAAINPASLDDQSAFIATLGQARTRRMRDVLGTIAADQDAVIRAPARGVLVVDGGPGTGKTVVALHRAAYLLYADPNLAAGRGGVLFVGPNQHFLSYVEDVLPGLGEDGVRMCTLRDLVPEGATAPDEPDTEVARLKASTVLVEAIDAAARFYEEPPTSGQLVETESEDLWISADDWAEAVAAVDPAASHNESREAVWSTLLEIVLDTANDADSDAEGETDERRRRLAASPAMRTAVNRAWPLLQPTDIAGDLLTVPAFLRHCAPGLTPAQIRTLTRLDPLAWTVSDLPLLDAARRRIGDPDSARRTRRREAALAAQRQEMDAVVDHLVAADDSEMQVMSMLRGLDLRAALVDQSGHEEARDPLAGPFGHIVVDEAQELTDAEWTMLLARCPSRDFTVVGDRAQARAGFTGTWPARLAAAGLPAARTARLTVNYRTPAEVMAAAAAEIVTAVPDAPIPTSVRHTSRAVRYRTRAELPAIIAEWRAAHAEGTACVIADADFAGDERVLSLTPVSAKGLEFDLVILVEPAALGDGIAGAVDRYVAMTRATGELVILR